MKNRIPTYPGRVTMTPVPGQANTYDMARADQPTQEGTPLDANTFLKDATAQALGLTQDDPTVDDALNALSASLKDGVFVDRQISKYAGDEFVRKTSSYGDSIAFGNGKYVAVNNGYVRYSDDAENWTDVVFSQSEYDYNKIKFGANKFVLIGGTNTITNTFYYSTDGITWISGTLPLYFNASAGQLAEILFVNEQFFAFFSEYQEVMYGDWINGGILTSSDGINWTKIQSNTSSFRFAGVVYGKNKFLATSKDNTRTVMYSDDGVTWITKKNSLPYSDYWEYLAYGDDMFMAATKNTSALYMAESSDGITWSPKTMPDISYISDGFLKFINGKFWLAKNVYPKSLYCKSTSDDNWVLKANSGIISSDMVDGIYVSGKQIILCENMYLYSETEYADYILNSNNEKITIPGSQIIFETGSYVGTGLTGESNPTVIYYSKKPSAILISEPGYGYYASILFGDAPRGAIFEISNINGNNGNITGIAANWYSDHVSFYTTSSNTDYAMNSSGSIYNYVLL